MKAHHRTQRLRVAPPTLEPDPAFLGVLADLGAGSRPAAPRAARSAGLRMIAATASVAVIVAATWAAGMQTGVRSPHPPADRPVQQETSATSDGDVGTPQPDVSTVSGSPLSPGLPDTTSSRSERGVDPRADRGQRPANRDDLRRAGSPRSAKPTTDDADDATEAKPGRRAGQQGHAKKSAEKATKKWGKQAGKASKKASKKAGKKAGKARNKASNAGKKRTSRSHRPARAGRGPRK